MANLRQKTEIDKIINFLENGDFKGNRVLSEMRYLFAEFPNRTKEYEFTLICNKTGDNWLFNATYDYSCKFENSHVNINGFDFYEGIEIEDEKYCIESLTGELYSLDGEVELTLDKEQDNKIVELLNKII